MLVIKTSINYQVAKKTKESEMNLFYLNDEEETPKKKVVRKKKNKKKSEKKEQNNQLFSFDNEIVIGVTRKEEPKKEVQKKGKNNKTKNKTQTKNKVNESNKKNKKKNNKIKQKNSKKTIEKRNISQEEQEKMLNKRKRIISIIKYGTLSILIITAILCAMFSPLFNIKTINVEGNNKITEKEIMSLSQIQIEENTFKLNKRKIKEEIKSNPYIKEVTITRKLPSTITIKVKEREPAYMLEYAGSYVYLDDQGYLLEISTEKLELPILQGEATETSDFVPGNRLCVEDLEKLGIVMKIIELAQDNEIYSLITRIDIENGQNIKLIFETKEKMAYLGDESNLNTKILTIKSIIEKEEGKAGEIYVDKDLNKEYPVFRERV